MIAQSVGSGIAAFDLKDLQEQCRVVSEGVWSGLGEGEHQQKILCASEVVDLTGRMMSLSDDLMPEINSGLRAPCRSTDHDFLNTKLQDRRQHLLPSLDLREAQ